MRNTASLRAPLANHESVSRRNWLSATGLQAAGLGPLHQFWGAIGQAGSSSAASSPVASSLATKTRRAKSVIMIFNCGAPSHIDLWDMKPQAPSEIRGSFDPISTNVPGIEISELLPEVAKRMDKLSIVRTLHHNHGGHKNRMPCETVMVDTAVVNRICWLADWWKQAVVL